WVLMTDIMGDEDHYGDMDFKIAGTQNGITGIQLDLKIDGISPEIIKATIKQSREARIFILRKMLSAISRPADDIASTAPRLFKTRIDPEKIGLLIGPGGKTIRAIQDASGASIEIDNDGTVVVSASNEESALRALNEVNRLTASVEVGKIYEGQVTSIKDFGAFIEILPGRDGLCHISEIAEDYVDSMSGICKVGDRMLVKVVSIDDQNRIKLSRKAALKELKG
ncbi:MAG: S1 RNA-binding domain-containing protein, partial [Planctomycetaceae bacterium]|nr:S1 RNA-binding domain-containing protein [Planctomycetaceae bacterium]